MHQSIAWPFLLDEEPLWEVLEFSRLLGWLVIYATTLLCLLIFK